MTLSEDQNIRNWVLRWKQASDRLSEIHKAEIREADTSLTIQLLDDAFQSTLQHHGPSPSSGLVDQQRWFMKAGK